MKGISHFISGVAAASFCPWTVQAAIEGNPMYFVLGGAFGFCLWRFDPRVRGGISGNGIRSGTV